MLSGLIGEEIANKLINKILKKHLDYKKSIYSEINKDKQQSLSSLKSNKYYG